jgi:GT2 family glycosyltransferase
VCVERVGLFDEEISPGYAYFEDCDYVERMLLEKVRITPAHDAGVTHGGSKTLEAASQAEMQEHHRRFLLAKANFEKKWGRGPNLSRRIDYDDSWI